MASRREYHEVTFEKGVLESSEESMLPLGFASELTNWMPEPLGNLRCRTGWKNVSTTGAPATRQTRSIGFLATQSLFQTPARVQTASNKGSVGASGSVAATWPAATMAGNLLVLCVHYTAPATTLTVPGGWTLAIESEDGNTGVVIYYKANASSESGTVSVQTSDAATIAVHVAEYSNIAASSPVDVTAEAQGSSATVESGTTAVQTQGDALVLAFIGNESATATFSAQTNDFSEVQELTGSGTSSSTVLYDKVTTSPAAQSVSATSSASSAFAGAIVSFKAAAITSGTQNPGYYFAGNKDSATAISVYKINADSLDAGTWTNIDTVSVGSSAIPVAFTAALGNLIYTSPFFATLRRWGGGMASAITGSPAGQAIAFHKNRVFVGGTTAAPSRLWFSQLGDYTKFWDDGAGQTALSDSTNWIDINEDDGESIVDLCVFADGLMIAKRTTLWFLSGDGPDNFQMERIASGTGYPGRCICPTPYGAVVAGEDAVWLVSGGAELISKPIESSYAPTGAFVSTAYVDGQVHIVDSGTGTDYVFNIITGTWHTESVNSATEEPACVFSRLNRLYMGPMAATTGSLLSYRDFPQARGRDANTSQVFTASTPEMVLVTPEQRVTPRNVHYQIRQHGGTADDTGITVTPYYNGTAGTAHTISPQASAGVFADSFSVGHDTSGKGITTFKLTLSQTVPSDESSLMDIEALVLEADIEERPHY